MVYSACGNLLNQIANLNRISKPSSKLEFMVVQDQFVTLTAHFADVLLPAATSCERNDIHVPWSGAGHYALFMQQAIEPTGRVPDRLRRSAPTWPAPGLEGYDAKTEDGWLREFVGSPEMPTTTSSR